MLESPDGGLARPLKPRLRGGSVGGVSVQRGKERPHKVCNNVRECSSIGLACRCSCTMLIKELLAVHRSLRAGADRVSRVERWGSVSPARVMEVNPGTLRPQKRDKAGCGPKRTLCLCRESFLTSRPWSLVSILSKSSLHLNPSNVQAWTEAQSKGR